MQRQIKFQIRKEEQKTQTKKVQKEVLFANVCYMFIFKSI